MKANELMSKADDLLQTSRTAVMSTVDKEGLPQSRWMTPAIIRNRPSSLYCVTSPKSYKALSIQNPSPVTWMIQNPQLTEIVNLQGDLYLVDTPALRAEVIEQIASKLVVYWKVNEDPSDFVVLETVFRSGSYFKPMDNIRKFVTFS